MKKVIRNYIPQGAIHPTRKFECQITDVMGGGSLVEVHVKEVRKTRKWWQSRTRYFGTKSFWVDDYSTIMQGIDICIFKLIHEEEEDNLRRKKFEEFEKSA